MIPDHRPYLTETDLRTAEDVHDWILAWRAQAIEDAKADPGLGAMSVRLDYACVVVAKDIVCDLRTRLDRERRQACRRGARENFAKFSSFARWCNERRVVPIDEYEAMTLSWISAALAFRAAARGK